ncbi:secretion protein HlyD [Actinotalea sp. AC32]|nr:secretion protein HlyD [Actinotalea sp. AC32]
MVVARRIVFPALRLVVWAVIAVALVKIAFTGSEVVASESPLEPGITVTESHVTVTTGSIANVVTVPGTVTADPPVPVRATGAGTVHALLAPEGQRVEAGAALLEVRTETPVEPTVRTDPETGEQTVVERKPKVTRQTVTAPVAGTVHHDVLAGQVVSVGDTVGSISPGTLSVTGTLTPDQQYRLISAPGEATVTLKGGPAPFTCTGLRIGPAAQDAAAPVEGDPSAPAPSGAVRCSVPPDVTAFAGLGADLSIANGTAEGALVVPVTAVRGSYQNGDVWVVGDDGAAQERRVALGLTDGTVVQVTEGLAEGDTVLEFAPGAEVPECDPMTGC